MTKNDLAVILAVGVFVLLSQAVPSSESAPYIVASLLGLLAIMVKASFERRNRQND